MKYFVGIIGNGDDYKEEENSTETKIKTTETSEEGMGSLCMELKEIF
jgi:hypothetical protein